MDKATEQTGFRAGDVDPELQASIQNLVSALGGPDVVTRKYILGDEALSCLRDLRKWLQLYDAKYDRLDVACAIANTTLGTRDLPEILAQWEHSSRKANDAYLDRVALACLELLVPMTWQIELVGKEATSYHFSQAVFLRQAQAKYKRSILSHPGHNILKAVIRIAGPAMRGTARDRDTRNEGILTLASSFFRNILEIDSGLNEDRRTTLFECSRQKVLAFELTLASGMGTSFDTQDTIVLEALYYLLRGVDVARVYRLDHADEIVKEPYNQKLKQMLEIESEMKRSLFKPSRHSRFGTMIAMNEGGGEYIPVSGQRGVAGLDSTLSKVDESKKWHKPVLSLDKEEREKESFANSAVSVHNDKEALSIMQRFSSEFLDSSYNPLILKVQKLIERQHQRITKMNLIQYLYLAGWFIDAERSRSKALDRTADFKLVGSSLSKRSFGIIMMLLRRGIDPGEFKSTDLVHAGMVCFRQVLMTVREISFSPDEELRDTAESMKSRLFYEESWLALLSQLPRTTHRKSLTFTCETVALTHVLLKMLDEYSKQHTYVFVKMKRARARRGTGTDDRSSDEDNAEERERGRRESVNVTNERKFSFQKFVRKYINGATISTYERVLSSYRDVSEDMLLHVFSFFRRTFAKTESKALFYRMSLMRLLLTLVGQRGLPRESKAYGVAEQFLAYYVQKFVATVEQMPSLHVQLNEAMTPADAFYYDHSGQDKEKFKPPKYEFALTTKARKEFSAERQFSIIVAAIIDIGKADFLMWVEQVLRRRVNEGGAASGDEAEGNNRARVIHRQPLTLEKDRIKVIHSDALLRLFLRSMGLVVNTTAGQVFIPSGLDELNLINQLQWIAKYQREPVEFENGKIAMDFIKVEGDIDRDESSDDEVSAPLQLRRTEMSNTSGVRTSSRLEELDDHDHTGEGSSSSLGEEDEHINMSQSHVPSLHMLPSPSSQGSPQESSKKRKLSGAFALREDDADEDESLAESVATIRRRIAIDDEDEE